MYYKNNNAKMFIYNVNDVNINVQIYNRYYLMLFGNKICLFWFYFYNFCELSLFIKILVFI